MKVDFMMIGAQKCGTTSLAAQLAAHRQICFSTTKEPAYFNQEEAWRERLEEYHQLYLPEPGQLCGEASTMYTFLPEWQETHHRLYEYNPDLKLIYIMRDPVKRIVSHYAHNLVRGQEKLSPQEAVFKDPRYLNRSRYAVQIRPYLELFGRENILLLIFEEYVADQDFTLRRIADFLAISEDGFELVDSEAKHQSVGTPYLKYPVIENIVGTPLFQTMRSYIPASIRQPVRHRFFSNRLEEKPVFHTRTQEMLRRFLEDDIAAIEQIMERPIKVWCEV